MVSCQINPLVCDPNANCLSIQGTFVCQCRYGFLGDGHTCDPAPIYEGNDLVVSIGYALQKFNLDSQRASFIKYSADQMAIAGIDVDCNKGQIYYTDTYGSAILRADYIGQCVILPYFPAMRDIILFCFSRLQKLKKYFSSSLQKSIPLFWDAASCLTNNNFKSTTL